MTILNEMNSTSIGVVKTADFTLASTLYHLGFNIDGIDKHNKKRVYFYFRKTPELDSIINKYWNREILIKPQDFEKSQREIKARIYTDEE